MTLALNVSFQSPRTRFANQQAAISRGRERESQEPVKAAGPEVAQRPSKVGPQFGGGATVQDDVRTTLTRAADKYFGDKEQSGVKATISGNQIDTGDEELSPAEKRYQATLEIKSQEKARAKDMIVELGKQLQMVRKIYETNPKELVKQYTRILKQLKEAIAIYTKAAGEVREAARVLKKSMAAEAGTPSVPSAPMPSGESSTSTDDPASDAEVAESASEHEPRAQIDDRQGADDQSGSPSVEQRERAVGAYQKVELERYRTDETPEGMLAREDKQFITEVRGLLEKMKEYFHEARVKAIGMYGSGFLKSETNEELEEALKEVEEDLADFEQDIGASSPAAAWATRIVI